MRFRRKPAFKKKSRALVLVLAIFIAIAFGCTEAQAETTKQASELDATIAQLEQAVASNPNDAEAHGKLGEAYYDRGRLEEAAAELRRALEINRDFHEALNTLAWLLATTEDARLRDPEKAVTYAQRAVKLTGEKNPSYLDTLAEAYFQAGQVQDAVRAIQKAIAFIRSEYAPELLSRGLPVRICGQLLTAFVIPVRFLNPS